MLVAQFISTDHRVQWYRLNPVGTHPFFWRFWYKHIYFVVFFSEIGTRTSYIIIFSKEGEWEPNPIQLRSVSADWFKVVTYTGYNSVISHLFSKLSLIWSLIFKRKQIVRLKKNNDNMLIYFRSKLSDDARYGTILSKHRPLCSQTCWRLYCPTPVPSLIISDGALPLFRLFEVLYMYIAI